MTKPQIDEYGTKRWFNEEGQLHSDGDKPAIERVNGDKLWFQNGRLHRGGDKPAVELADGYKAWYRNGKRHRKGNRPAVEWAGGDKEWFKGEELIDEYHPNFECIGLETRERALEWLNSKSRPYSRDLFLADINKMFPPTNPSHIQMSRQIRDAIVRRRRAQANYRNAGHGERRKARRVLEQAVEAELRCDVETRGTGCGQ